MLSLSALRNHLPARSASAGPFRDISARLKRLHWLLPLLVLFAVMSIPYALKAGEHASAFVRWRNQIAELFSAEDIYLRHAYPNPPIMGLILYPLILLPPVIGALFWFYLKAGMAILALHWTFRLVED